MEGGASMRRGETASEERSRPLAAREPAVVGRHERPALPWQAALAAVVLDVHRSVLHVRAAELEDLPAGAAPDGVPGEVEAGRDERGAAGFLKGGYHLLGPVAMFADEQVGVLGHDGAGVAGVTAFADGVGETAG